MTKKKQDTQGLIIAVNAMKQHQAKCMIDVKWKIYFAKRVGNAETK